MRLWCLHPCYLDGRGLVALWREGLLARKVLKGLTKGYRRHPQLERFKTQNDPVAAIDCYLRVIFNEAVTRGYHFNAGKLGTSTHCPAIKVTAGQLDFELRHLKRKLRLRDRARYREICIVKKPEPHPSFTVIEGGIEPWERTGVPRRQFR